MKQRIQQLNWFATIKSVDANSAELFFGAKTL